MEGFGLPAVEAAACGCPVIATKASPLQQLLGGGGIYIDTGADDITRALETVLSSSDLRSRMRASGLAAAGRLSWDEAARQMMSVIRTVAVA
jgi:glycosyltransferase involved in cell wall biosynthesis